MTKPHISPWMVVLLAATAVLLPRTVCAQVRSPFQVLDEEPDNVYLQSIAPNNDQLTNQGGIHLTIDVTYFTTYMYRGVDQSTPPKSNERSLQFDTRLTFDLGKLPHPFVGFFTNIFNSDPVSRFEEVRPYAGLEWTARPLTVAAGFNGYIFPNREGVDTQEVWMRLSADDSGLFHTEHPFLSPYAYGAYDFNKYRGFYVEAGIRHDFIIGDTGAIFSIVSDFAYIAHNRYYRVTPKGEETGLQHYDVGGILTYDLNNPLHIPARFGHWEVKGYLYYSGPVQDTLRADSRVWGGVGLTFKY